MKRVLLDQGLAPATAEQLREAGWDAVHVSEIGMSGASDIKIMARAVEQGRVCVTLDRDFHSFLARSGAREPSVVLLRLQGLKAGDLTQLLIRIWPDIEAGGARCVAVTVSPRAVRSRPLPLAAPPQEPGQEIKEP